MNTDMDLTAVCRQAGAEGTVLLRNEGQVLPLTQNEEVAIFGRIQLNYYCSGTGSGGAVNTPYKTNLLEGCRTGQGCRVNETVASLYEEWIREHPFDDGGAGWACEPWCQQEMPLEDAMVEAAAKTSHKAIIVIGRTAGEDKDNAFEKGGFLLTDAEEKMVAQVIRYFDDVILVLNTANIIDLQFAYTEPALKKIKAILLAWQGGMEGGNAIADVLTGKVTPSGKLPDTIAQGIQDYSSTKNHGGELENRYEEDIYIGYRYFETFAPDKVLVPFGYGLSYTKFAIQVQEAYQEKESGSSQFIFQIRVTNIGSKYSGKEVVQLYLEAPQGKLGRAKRELVGFAKTKTLACTESQMLEIRVDAEALAAYDDSGVTGFPYSYVLEEGTYRFYIGANSREVQQVFLESGEGYQVTKSRCVKTCEQALAPTVDFNRMKPGNVKEDGTYEITYEAVPKRTYSMEERILANLPQAHRITGNQGIKLQQVRDGKADMDAFIAQLSEKELMTIVRGEGMCSDKVTAGTAAAFGGVSEALLGYGIPVACCADGPSGIRMDNGSQATQVPIGTLLAATFNTELVEQLFALQGQEMIANEIDTLLGPGINIHRHPLNGRNFEYFSEDALLSGKMAAAIVRGLASNGVQATIKHFACNSQETNRHMVNAIVSERAAREIYLKSFEIAVKEGNAKSVMTSYNPLNGYWTASSYDLNTTILRKEWGFDGLVMTDWWAKMNDVVTGGEASTKKAADMVRAQNDVYMVVHNNGAELNGMGDDLEEALSEGRLTIGELQRSAKNLCGVIMTFPAMNHIGKQKKPVKHFTGQKEMIQTERKLTREDNRLTFEGKSSICFEIIESGEYEILVKLMSPQTDRAQTVCNAKLNGEICSTFQTNGTEGKWMVQKVNTIFLEKGMYQMTLEFPKAGMQVAYMELQYK